MKRTFEEFISIQQAKMRAETPRKIHTRRQLDVTKVYTKKRDGRSNYMKKAITRIMKMTKAQRELYVARNGFEEAAFELLKATQKGGNTSVQAWKEIKETLGERIGSNWKDTMEGKKERATVVNDLPTGI